MDVRLLAHPHPLLSQLVGLIAHMILACPSGLRDELLETLLDVSV
jgi:hypothetical protein